jgi:hypothetical protein
MPITPMDFDFTFKATPFLRLDYEFIAKKRGDIPSMPPRFYW